MRKNKTIGILVVLLGLMAAFWWWQQQAKPTDKTEAEYLKKVAILMPEAISQISLTKGETKTELKKENGIWQIDGYKANQQTVNQLINNLLKASGPELVAQTNVQHKSLGVDEAGTKLTLNGGDKQLVLVVGSSDSGGYYVKFADGEAVYLVKDLPAAAAEPNRDGWLDKTLAQIQENNIKSISVTDKNGKTIKIVRTGSDWFEEGKTTALDSGLLTPLVTTLAALTSQGLVEDEKNVGKNPIKTIVLELDNGSQTLIVYPHGSDGFAAGSSDRAGNFMIDKTTVDNLNLDSKMLQPKPSPSPTPAS